MKKIILTLLLVSLTAVVWSQGIPFIRNYTADEYNAHKQNFDIVTNEDGTVFVANFEGLLYYDNSQWRKIHTGSITRITSVFRDSKGRIWAGGYNYLGYVEADKNGILSLVTLDENRIVKGEVLMIWERKRVISFLDSDGNVYVVKGRKVVLDTNGQVPQKEQVPPGIHMRVSQIQHLGNGLRAIATTGDGLYIANNQNHILYQITEQNGLCSNNISHITYNGHGILWGATDNGIFSIAIPSIYSHFTQSEGLRGEVLSAAKLNGNLYVGTLNGLYQKKGYQFVQVNNMTLACWQLVQQDNSLLAATSDGVFKVQTTGTTRITTSNTMSVMVVDGGLYAGETDAVYRYDQHGNRQKICDAERVTMMLKDKSGTIWMRNMYGRIWKSDDQQHFIQQKFNRDKEEIATLVNIQDEVKIITVSTQVPFPYPLFSYLDYDGYTWLTNNKGKRLYAFKNGAIDRKLSDVVHPLMDYSVRTMLREGNLLCMGGESGLNVVDNSQKDPVSQVKPHLYIRSVVLHGDSVLWGGYGQQPQQLSRLSSDDRQITIHYSIDYPSLLLPTQYRYRLNGGRWTSWEFETMEEFNNMPYGNYLFEVQSRNAYGQLSETASISFRIDRPFYIRWYMMVLYILLFALFVYATAIWRVHQLRKEKLRLENLVQERTNEVVKLEKVATVAKLTQGLIDRILNPLNYINNFAKLSIGLVKDVVANVEDDKENMNEENYEDTIDVLDMLKGNLEKVGEHGANTTRTLKAMEAILKDRSGNMTQIDLIAIIRQNEEMVRKYFEKEITDYHINVVFDLPVDHLSINGNGEQLSKTLMSMLGNAIYAVVKKAQRQQYAPKVALTIKPSVGQVMISIRDNGIGIEQTILNKIFDPFFTTKTTGEADGVGLYLSKEIIQNHKGDIGVLSEKDVFTEFTIKLPTL